MGSPLWINIPKCKICKRYIYQRISQVPNPLFLERLIHNKKEEILFLKQWKINEPCPINQEDLPRGKGIQTVLKLSTSYSPSFVDLIIGEP